MALPKLTDEQRKEALAKAAEARKARAELKAALKRGETNLQEVLEKAETDEIIGKTKVSALLEALPKVGKVKAKEIMEDLEIACLLYTSPIPRDTSSDLVCRLLL